MAHKEIREWYLKIPHHFDDIQIKEGDLGEYTEIKIAPSLYIVVFRNPGLSVRLEYGGKFETFLHGVRDIVDLKNFTTYINGKDIYGG